MRLISLLMFAASVWIVWMATWKLWVAVLIVWAIAAVWRGILHHRARVKRQAENRAELIAFDADLQHEKLMQGDLEYGRHGEYPPAI